MVCNTCTAHLDGDQPISTLMMNNETSNTRLTSPLLQLSPQFSCVRRTPAKTQVRPRRRRQHAGDAPATSSASHYHRHTPHGSKSGASANNLARCWRSCRGLALALAPALHGPDKSARAQAGGRGRRKAAVQEEGESGERAAREEEAERQASTRQGKGGSNGQCCVPGAKGGGKGRCGAIGTDSYAAYARASLQRDDR